MIAESAPCRYDLSDPAQAEAAWREWFEPYFQIIAERQRDQVVPPDQLRLVPCLVLRPDRLEEQRLHRQPRSPAEARRGTAQAQVPARQRQGPAEGL